MGIYCECVCVCSVIDIYLCVLSQSFGPRHSNSSPHSSYLIYSRKRRGRPGDVASRCGKVSPPHFLVAVSTPVYFLTIGVTDHVTHTLHMYSP